MKHVQAFNRTGHSSPCKNTLSRGGKSHIILCSGYNTHPSHGRYRLPLLLTLGALLLVAVPCSRVLAQFTPNGGYQSPVGVTGIFNGNISTAGSYDPLTHNAHRQVDDIPPIPGSIGQYPLKMTRYYNSRKEGLSALGPGWSSEYGWGLSAKGDKLGYPDGSVHDTSCSEVVGVSDRWETAPDGARWWRRADGGAVIFDTTGAVKAIVDPYGQKTTIEYGTNWEKVTEPGGEILVLHLEPRDVDQGGRARTWGRDHY
jgi:hypothetical protein